MTTPSITLEQARARIAAVSWAALPGEPDNVARLHDNLLAWLSGSDPRVVDDAHDEVLDVVSYVAERDEAADVLLALALDLLGCAALGGPERLVEVIHELVALGGAARCERARDGLAPWLAGASRIAQRALVRTAFFVFADASITPPWREMLESVALDPARDAPDRAAAIITLVRARAAGPVVSRLLEQAVPSVVSHALAFALRSSGEPLTPAMRAHVAANGQPGQMTSLFARARLPEGRMPLPPFEQEATPLEPAEVVFAGKALVQVKHAQLGSFTLKIPGEGLAPGATVWIGDVVPPPTNRPLRAEWKVGGETRHARFELDGRRIA